MEAAGAGAVAPVANGGTFYLFNSLWKSWPEAAEECPSLGEGLFLAQWKTSEEFGQMKDWIIGCNAVFNRC